MLPFFNVLFFIVIMFLNLHGCKLFLTVFLMRK
jgi:hypothetical protein